MKTIAYWIVAAALVTLSFPAHLLFEVPAAAFGRPADWANLGGRTALLAAGLLFAAAAWRRRGPASAAPRPRPVPQWLRLSAYAGAVIPIAGFTVPHLFWAFGVPLGVDEATVREIHTESPVLVAALCLAPTLGGLVTIGLASRWGQRFPSWVPLVGGRLVPRPVALAPAGVISIALVAYGLIGIWLMGGALLSGATSWGQLATGWAVVVTELVFLAWGVALSVATFGYYRVTR